MSFLCREGTELFAHPIHIAFARGGAVPFGTAKTESVENYNLFKAPGAPETLDSYDTIGSIPDDQMTSINSDILTVRKRASTLSIYSTGPLLQRGTELKDVFAALKNAGHHYNHFIAYFCRGTPFGGGVGHNARYVNPPVRP